jgi:uncharacterized integral membrane protein
MSHADPTNDHHSDRVFWDANWPLPVWIFGAFVALMMMLVAYVAQRMATL